MSGLVCLLKKRLEDLKIQQRAAAGAYKAILGPNPRLLEAEVETAEDMDWQESSDEDDDDDVTWD